MGYPGFILIISFKYSVFQIINIIDAYMYTMTIYMYDGIYKLNLFIKKQS